MLYMTVSDMIMPPGRNPFVVRYACDQVRRSPRMSAAGFVHSVAAVAMFPPGTPKSASITRPASAMVTLPSCSRSPRASSMRACTDRVAAAASSKMALIAA
jgi:hypothetical protein